MPSAMRKIINILHNGGLTDAEYRNVHKRLLTSNRSVLVGSLVVACLLLALMTIASFFVASISHQRFLYVGLLVGLLLIAAALKLGPRDSEPFLLTLFYLFFVVVFTFAIFLGVVQQPRFPATTFCVMLFALPLLITDRPWRVALLLTLVTVVFCMGSLAEKDAAVSSLDCVNAISFLFLGAVTNTIMMTVKYASASSASEVERQRDTDALTGLRTRAAAEAAILRDMATPGSTGALLVVDVDDFKTVNDTKGHAYGDAVLRIMGDSVRETFRQSDFAGRFGGDEFVVFLPNTVDRAVIAPRVEALIDLLNERLSSDNSDLYVTGSIGIALYPTDATEYAELFKCADLALYDAKAKGKNCYAFYADHASATAAAE